MTIKQIIEKAIKGGWYGYSGFGHKPYAKTKKQSKHMLECLNMFDSEKSFKMRQYWYLTMLQQGVNDPLFWKALGKSLKWEGKTTWKAYFCDKDHQKDSQHSGDWYKFCPEDGTEFKEKDVEGESYGRSFGEWHNFIGHLEENKTVESFFAKF